MTDLPTPSACRTMIERRLGGHAARILERLKQENPRFGKLDVLPEDGARVLAAYGRRCAYCERGPEGHLGIDFLVPPVRGGTAQPENLVASCNACRSGRNGRHLDEFLESRLDLDAHAVYARIARGTAVLRAAGSLVARRAA